MGRNGEGVASETLFHKRQGRNRSSDAKDTLHAKPAMATSEAFSDVKALAFDVFGTCVNWQKTVPEELSASFASKANSSSVPATLRERSAALSRQGCKDLALQWAASYAKFTASFVPGVTPWKDVDTHYFDSLVTLLEEQGLREAYSEEEIRELSLAWHRLEPWHDAAEGLRRLRGKFTTAALSNGNQEILRDLNRMLDGGFAVLLSAADFGAYKPRPAVYSGAADALGAGTGEVALVAAHLYDLEAARSHGWKTVYVERPNEERWPKERVEEAKAWVDVWVSADEEGFLELARWLGC